MNNKLTRRQFLRYAVALGLSATTIAFLDGCGILATPTPTKISRVGFLTGGSPGPNTPIDMFQQALRESGYLEGKNIIIEPRFAEGRDSRLPDLAAELIQLKVDLIVATSTPGVLAAKQATSTIPIVMAIGGDPVRVGLVSSYAHPEGNVTGTFQSPTGLSGKALETIKQIAPAISRVGVLWLPSNPSHPPAVKEIEDAGQALGVKIISLPVRDASDFESAFKSSIQERIEGIIVARDPLTSLNRKKIAEFAIQNRLPSIFTTREFVDDGGLISYGSSLYGLFQRSVRYVDKIIKGTKPADLPIEQATKFEMVINLKTAQAIGLTIPRSILEQATEVIQ